MIEELIDDKLKIAKAKTLRLRSAPTRRSTTRSPTWRKHAAHHAATVRPDPRARRHFSEHAQGAHPRRADLEPVGARQVQRRSADRRNRHRQSAARRATKATRRRGRLHLHAPSGHVRGRRAGRARPSSRPSAARRKTCAAASSPATRACALSRALRDVAVREPIIAQLGRSRRRNCARCSTTSRSAS